MDFDLKQALTESLSNFEITMSIMITIAIAVVTVLIILYVGVWKFRTKVLPSRTESPRKPRFRKRDKVLFYGRKMLRKVRSFTKNTMTAYSGLGPGRGRGIKKRQIVVKLAKRLLRMRRDPTQPQLRVKEPPQSFLEADSSELQGNDFRLPSEVLYMLKSVRVFGHFKEPLFLELVKHMESRSVPSGGYLFQIGDMDDSIYVVQSGKIDVIVSESDGTEYIVKELSAGDCVHSLLSVLDVLTGHPSPYKTVSAKAVLDSTILRYVYLVHLWVYSSYREQATRGLALDPQHPLHSKLIQSPVHRAENNPPQHLSCYQSLHEVPTRTSESVSKHVFSVAPEKDQTDTRGPSDFDVACLQARVSSLDRSYSLPQPQVYIAFFYNIHKTVCRKELIAMAIHLVEEVHFSVCIYLLKMDLKITSSRHRPRTKFNSDVNNDLILKLAKADLITLLKLKNESLLEGKLHVKYLKAGAVLIRQGDQDASLVFVVSGKMQVLQQIVGESSKEALLFEAQPGDIVGSLAVLTGEPSFFTIRAKTDVRVVIISKDDFYIIMREQPSVVLNVAYTTLARMTPFVRQIDFALDWMVIEAGKALFRQGDHSECIFIVLTGRLRSVITLAGGKKELTGEYGRGELVGIVEVLTQTERATTVIAVRDTELAKMPAELLNLIKRKYPQIVTRLIHLLGQRILGHLQNKNTVALTGNGVSVENRQSVTNLATVAVLPISKDVPLTNFTLELQHSLNAIGPTTRLTSDIIKARLGAAALESVNEFRLFSWLGQQEDIHRMVLYQCDFTMTKWSKCCIRQADCILIVGLAENGPAVGEVETQMETIYVRAQKELILLHKEDAEKPRRTVEWLNARGWCSTHHHIRCSKRIFSRRSLSQTLDMYQKLFQSEADRQSDFSRLARSLTGTSIGLVLGGGGARGLAHVGLIRAMIEAGIPIDMVGGTSIGSIIGALWCEERNITRFTQRAREWSMIMASLWQKIIDLTYPVTSMFTGEDVGYNHGKTLFSGWKKGGLIQKLFNEKKLEKVKEPNLMAQQQHTQPAVPVMAYFTDLAEMVSRIDEPTKPIFYTQNDSDSDGSFESEVLLGDVEFDEDCDDEDEEEEFDEHDEDIFENDVIVEENPAFSHGSPEGILQQ
ncbi:hypothetical protein ScPMuIL_014353 [Solemya velum]